MHLLTMHEQLMDHLSRAASACPGKTHSIKSTSPHTALHDPVAFRNYMRINTIGLVDEYKKALAKPIRVQFFSKFANKDTSPSCANADTIAIKYARLINTHAHDIMRIVSLNGPKSEATIQALLEAFLRTASSASVNTASGSHSPGSPLSVCTRCSAKDSIIQDGNMYTCIQCGNLLDLVCTASTLKDIDRVNIASKYAYDRCAHFRMLLAQLQGKGVASATLDAGVKAVSELMHTHKLTTDTLTKRHVALFMRDAGLGKHMDDLAAVHKNITGKPALDISVYEEQLVRDFEQILQVNERMHRERERERAGLADLATQPKGVNMHNIVYHLLLKYKVNIAEDDKVLFERKGRVNEHALRSIFESLGWEWSPKRYSKFK